VKSVDHRAVGDGTQGPVTRKLAEVYETIVRGRNPAYAAWLTPAYASRKPAAV
jgi:branched-chain amino acid aminotransferase